MKTKRKAKEEKTGVIKHLSEVEEARDGGRENSDMGGGGRWKI